MNTPLCLCFYFVFGETEFLMRIWKMLLKTIVCVGVVFVFFGRV